MRAIVATTALALAVGCGQAANPEPALEGTAVFFNFYGEPVQVYVNDELLFAERLDVDDSSTGLSKETSLSLSGCSQIKIVTSSHQSQQRVCPEKSGFGLWVSPSSAGGPVTIEFQPIFTPGLD
ncbi:hypothetical protein NYR55_07245 [Sphingomonas sp. BGYR3]|uniref:hypothetical protein n=1 Tax=Sphingomonas sp. BGYR3 TaxID=2975483 RepID=UPI0021A70DD3|nr:hypothetical protein [Sphingomonas sp. BGYR3]MDG5488415.1 hypothetical protein [Sphingomonas sp. BGYR3]